MLISNFLNFWSAPHARHLIKLVNSFVPKIDRPNWYFQSLCILDQVNRALYALIMLFLLIIGRYKCGFFWLRRPTVTEILRLFFSFCFVKHICTVFLTTAFQIKLRTQDFWSCWYPFNVFMNILLLNLI